MELKKKKNIFPNYVKSFEKSFQTQQFVHLEALNWSIKPYR